LLTEDLETLQLLAFARNKFIKAACTVTGRIARGHPQNAQGKSRVPNSRELLMHCSANVTNIMSMTGSMHRNMLGAKRYHM